MTFSRRILTGLAAGIATGLFFGEHAAVFRVAADGFVKLLQMMVLPYITVSIVASLGSLGYTEARRLGLRAAAVIGGLWVVAIGFALLIPLTFPSIQNASFFSSSLVERHPPFNFVDLYIPSNPFRALANDIVPAVVLFSIVLGVALVGVEGKERLLGVLGVVRDAISSATRLVTRLTPYGLFAIAATAAGTLDVAQLSRIQVYLVAYVAMALLISLWVLPGLVAALTPIRALDILRESQASLLTAFIAGDLFIVLPGLMHASETLLRRLDPADREVGRLPEVIVPASFNFPHTGKLLSLSFILFAGWFSDASVPVQRYPQFAISGLLSFFGSLNAAVPFMLDQFRIPADTFQLFLATGVVNSRIGSLVAAVHTLAVALLVTCAITGRLQWSQKRVLTYCAVTATLLVTVVGGARVFFAATTLQEYSKDKVLASMQILADPVPATIERTPVVPAATTMPTLDAIAARGVLRVGFVPNALPFAFINGTGDLVGFDISLAHMMAHDLDVTLAFVPIDRDKMTAQVVEGYCDLVMSGIVLTAERARQVLFSDSYMDETFALVVPDHQRERFELWSDLREQPSLHVAVSDLPYYVRKLHELLPRASVEARTNLESVFEHWPANLDAVALPAERGSSWTLKYPAYSVVVPMPDPIHVPLAYPIGRNDPGFARYVNTWIALKRKDGTIDANYKYWILGQDAEARHPRWSIVHDVLHWMD